MNLNNFTKTASNWFSATPQRSLDRAYQAALKIQEIEDEYFQGKKVSAENADYGESVFTYIKGEVRGYLQKINMELAFFKASRFFINLSDSEDWQNQAENRKELRDKMTTASLIFEKLQFIDQVTAKYKASDPTINSIAIIKAQNQNLPELADAQDVHTHSKRRAKKESDSFNISQSEKNEHSLESASQKTGALPRSFINTLNRIKQEIEPKSGETEEQVLNKYRRSRYKTSISIKFILLLIIVPLLTHQLTKTFFLNPIVEKYFNQHEQIIFLNRDLEEEAFQDLKHFEEGLRYRSLIGLAPELSPEQVEEQVRDKAKEITNDYRFRGIDAIANIFADLFSLIAFAVVIFTSRKEIEFVKSFLDEIMYGLSDSAKAFMIILFTDMFVGFHSPHGWEVILEGIGRHFGLPENRQFDFLFIATFPVILDTVFKYWIFRYLNRISPSSVATYRNMNE